MSAPPIFFKDPAALRAWFAQHGAQASELIVGFVKIHTGKATLTWPQAVDEALSFGWIDGVRTSIDENHYKIRFSPRKPNSNWSAVNIKRVPELEAEGKMTKAGLAVFALRTEAKSRTGSYEQSEFPELSVAEFAEFKKSKAAWAFYQDLPPSHLPMSVAPDLVGTVLELLSGMGSLRQRKMFGGTYIYCDGLFIATVHDDVLYFKANADSAPAFVRLGLRQFSYPKAGGVATLQYYEAPTEVFGSRAAMKLWAGKALVAARQDASAKNSGKRRAR